MTTDHQAYVLGEAVDQVQKSRSRVGVTSHHQTLRSERIELCVNVGSVHTSNKYFLFWLSQ